MYHSNAVVLCELIYDMTGAGKQIDVLCQSAENIIRALHADGILRSKHIFAGGKYMAVGGYGEVFLEPDYKKKPALDCDLTFWAVQLLSLLNPAE